MPERVGVIVGTGLYGLLAKDVEEERAVETPYGTVDVLLGQFAGVDVALLERHGRNHGLPPHRIPHRANVQALVDVGVQRVIAMNSVGSLRQSVLPGTFLVPDDWLDFSLVMEERTFFHDRAVHVDMSEPYCPHGRAALLASAPDAGSTVLRTEPEGTGAAEPLDVYDGGVYVATPGPRFESPAEVRHYGTLGHVIGMTGCPEAPLARERGLCYASLCVVANYATGLAPRVSARDIVRDTHAARERALPLLEGALRRWAADPVTCACPDVRAEAVLEEP